MQALVERALGKITSEKITLFASSRTDAGVHAKQQVVSFTTGNRALGLYKFVSGTNNFLPEDIRVVEAWDVPDDFHANRSVKYKTYRYFIYMSRKQSAFAPRYAWHVYSSLKFELIHQAAKMMVGTHDFSSFRTGEEVTKTSIRTVHAVKLGRKSKHIYYIDVTADGFLRHMVRGVVGVLVEVGLGKKNPEDIPEILERRDRAAGGINAPAQGLFLWNVTY